MRAAGVSEPRSVSTLPCGVGVVAARRRELLSPAGGVGRPRRRLRLATLTPAARSSWARTSPVSGLPWPGHAAAGSRAASLRMLARA